MPALLASPQSCHGKCGFRDGKSIRSCQDVCVLLSRLGRNRFCNPENHFPSFLERSVAIVSWYVLMPGGEVGIGSHSDQVNACTFPTSLLWFTVSVDAWGMCTPPRCLTRKVRKGQTKILACNLMLSCFSLTTQKLSNYTKAI